MELGCDPYGGAPQRIAEEQPGLHHLTGCRLITVNSGLAIASTPMWRARYTLRR